MPTPHDRDPATAKAMEREHLCSPGLQLVWLRVIDKFVIAGRRIIGRHDQNDTREVLREWVVVEVSSADQRKAEGENRHQDQT
jgi:hypothetical protein